MSLPFTDRIYVFTPGAVGVTSTRTSPSYDVSKRQVIVVVFTGSNISSGNGAFSVDGSVDNSYWVTGITMQDATAVSTAITAGILTKTISANGVAGVYIRPGWHYLRVKVVVTTDGRDSA